MNLANPTPEFPTMMTMTSGSEDFYANLPRLCHFAEVTNRDNFVPVPTDWYIVITDIVNSTSAILAGRYKAVNLIGATTIVSVLNIATAHGIDIPFIFGGDGATLLIPPRLLTSVQEALLSLQELCQTEFSLKLRTGIMPVSEVIKEHDLRIAKLQISVNYDQALLRGGGVTHATNLIKQEHSPYQLQGSAPRSCLDLSGLECRWQDIPSPHQEVLTLIVSAHTQHPDQADGIYCGVISQITRIYGEDHQHCPVTLANLNLSFDDRQLSYETQVRCPSAHWWDRLLYLLKIKLENFLGWLLMSTKAKIKDMDWGQYKQIVTESTDYKKFDDALRLVISGSEIQRQELLQYLESQYQQQKLVYGYHTADRSLMTCLVFVRNGQQVHFIDGADGGYSYAARLLKERLQAMTKTPTNLGT
jgi:hypothetical protein